MQKKVLLLLISLVVDNQALFGMNPRVLHTVTLTGIFKTLKVEVRYKKFLHEMGKGIHRLVIDCSSESLQENKRRKKAKLRREITITENEFQEKLKDLKLKMASFTERLLGPGRAGFACRKAELLLMEGMSLIQRADFLLRCARRKGVMYFAIRDLIEFCGLYTESQENYNALNNALNKRLNRVDNEERLSYCFLLDDVKKGKKVVECIPNLESLNLCGWIIDAQTIIELVMLCTQLQEIVVDKKWKAVAIEALRGEESLKERAIKVFCNE